MEKGTFSRLLSSAKEEVEAERKTCKSPPKAQSKRVKRGCAEAKDAIIPQMLAFWEQYYMQDDPSVQELFEFEIQNWQKFDPDQEEFTFEQTALHRVYCQMFERKVEEFLQQRDLSIDEFYRIVARELAEEEQDFHSTEGSTNKLLRILLRATDFQLWAQDMRQAARDQREMNDVD